MTNERKPGWYWVRIDGCEWETALWMDGGWRDVKKGSLTDEFWDEIGPRIPCPDEPWQCVPVEATDEMLGELHLVESFTVMAIRARYAAMLSAAPKP